MPAIMMQHLNSVRQPAALAAAHWPARPVSRLRSRRKLRSVPDGSEQKKLACELQALVCELGVDQKLCKALLNDSEAVDAVKSLASGDTSRINAYPGDPLGIQALVQLLEPHVAPPHQQALSAAAAKAAATPPQLSSKEELHLLLQEPLVKTGLSRIRCDPELGFSSYGSNPAIVRALLLLDQVLLEDSSTRQVIDCLVAATTAQAQPATEHLELMQQQREQQERWQVAQQQQQQQQRQRQHHVARTAVIARSSSSSHTSGSGGGSNKPGRGGGKHP